MLITLELRFAALGNQPSYRHHLFKALSFKRGSDMVGSILEGPHAVKRMEFELFSRLAAKFDLTREN